MARLIDPRKRKQVNLMSSDSRDKMMQRIKNNYVLFGCTDAFYIVDLTLKFSDSSYNIEVLDSVEYRGERDGNGNITLDPNFVTYKSNRYKLSVNYNILTVKHEDDYAFYTRDIKTSCMVAMNHTGHKVGFGATMEYTENDSAAKRSKITYVNLPATPVSEEVNSKDVYHLVIIFANVKTAPIVRFYKGSDIDEKSSEYVSNITDFEDKNSLFNSYYMKYNITVEERCIVADNSDIECMKYTDKANDILKYLEHESFDIDSDGVKTYENDLGISAESYTVKEPHGVKEEFYSFKYKDNVLFGSETKLQNRLLISNHEYYEARYDSSKDPTSYVDTDCEELVDNNDIKIMKNLYELLINDVSRLGESMDMDGNPILLGFNELSFKLYSDKNERRLFAIGGIDSIVSVSFQYVNDTAMFAVIKNADNIVTEIYDVTNLYQPYMIGNVRKEIYNLSQTIEHRVRYEDRNMVRFYMSKSLDSSTGDITRLYYSGPECTIEVWYDIPDKPVLKYLDSIIYAASDHSVTIRDEYGIPYQLNIH